MKKPSLSKYWIACWYFRDNRTVPPMLGSSGTQAPRGEIQVESTQVTRITCGTKFVHEVCSPPHAVVALPVVMARSVARSSSAGMQWICGVARSSLMWFSTRRHRLRLQRANRRQSQHVRSGLHWSRSAGCSNLSFLFRGLLAVRDTMPSISNMHSAVIGFAVELSVETQCHFKMAQA